MNERRQAFHEAAGLCVQYALSLSDEKLAFAEVALECAAIIRDACEQVLTIDEIGDGSCQELSSFLVLPEIDYSSGFPR